jgi:hypothetical protein
MNNNCNSKFISFIKETDASKVFDVLARKRVKSFVKVERSQYGYTTNYSFDVYVQAIKKDEALKILLRSKKTNNIAEIKKIHDNSCPRCSMVSVEKEGMSLVLLILSFLTLGMMYMVKRDYFVCQNCGFSWKEKYSAQKTINLFFWLVFNSAFWIIIVNWFKGII